MINLSTKFEVTLSLSYKTVISIKRPIAIIAMTTTVIVRKRSILSGLHERLLYTKISNCDGDNGASWSV